MCADLQPFYSGTHKWVPKIVLLLTLALSASGCSLLKNTLELPEKASAQCFRSTRETTRPIPSNYNPSCSALLTIISMRSTSLPAGCSKKTARPPRGVIC